MPKIRELEIPGVLAIEPDVHRDERGFFLETYHAEKYRSRGLSLRFVQDNHSRSCRGTVRGLHAQVAKPQAKLVRVASGEIFDVAVDVRRGSPSFGRFVTMLLSDANHTQLLIPPGFAHGFCVMSEFADVEYKCSRHYDAEDEIAVSWNDPQIGIPWPVDDPILSAKDRAAPPLAAISRLPSYDSSA